MLAIALNFPAGRYHATPWGRHVNEADVEWPPSPWRLLRALIAVWHRKLDADEFPRTDLDALVETLACALPVYRLPPGIQAHSRHYMPVGTRPVLIFDGFVHLARDAELVMAWPDLELDERLQRLLGEALRCMGFLGRAESWTEARLLDHWDGEANCAPAEAMVNSETGEAFEPVPLLVPETPHEYAAWSVRLRDETDWKALKPAARRRLEQTLPGGLVEALHLETGDIQAAGWSRAPGARVVQYRRPLESLRPAPTPGRPSPPPATTTARLVLHGKPLPRMEDALRIGELVRRAALKTAVDLGLPIPPELSGHDLPANNRHGHAFYLPEDSDGDGRIEHVLVHAPMGFGSDVLHILNGVRCLWERGGNEWRVVLESIGDDATAASPLAGASACWLSVTPYLHPWFAKKGFAVPEQIARECRERGMDEPLAVQPVESVEIGRGRRRRAVHFRRFRDKRGLIQPDTRGHLLRLEFAEPVSGPLALGFGCHFGLGMFAPLDRV